MKEKRPVYDETAELCVLGCFINFDDLRNAHIDSLAGDDFFVPAHKELFADIARLHGKGEPISAPRIGAENNELIGVSGDASFQAAQPLFAPSLAIVKRDSAVRRRMAEILYEYDRLASDPDSLTGGSSSLVPRPVLDLVEDDSIKEPPVLVAGLLHKGSALLLGAASKSFKSWSLIDLAISVANGKPWWNLPCERGDVLFVDFELTPHFWRKRAMEIANARQLGLDGIDLLNCRGHSPENALRAIERAAKVKPYALIPIDPLYPFLSGRDENAAGDVGAVMQRLGALAESTGAALAISHHFSKGNQSQRDSIDRFSGSGVFARFPDALLTMTKHEEDNAFAVDPIVRNFAPINPFVVRWQHPLMVRDGNLDPAKLKQAGGRPPQHSAKDLLELVQKPVSGQELEKLAFEAGICRTVYFDLRKQLVAQKLITQSEGTKLWQRIQ